MEQITQLKQLRDDALARLQFNADYKLLVSLDRLIREIEQLAQFNEKPKTTGSILPMIQKDKEASVTSATLGAEAEPKSAAEIDKAFDKLTDDLRDESDTNEKSAADDALKSAMIKPDTEKGNGALKHSHG